MPTIWTYLRATAVLVGSSAALLTGGIAHADPAPAPAPIPNIPQQLISSAANAPQILQNLATALGATPPAAPAAPGISFPGVPSAAAPAPATSGLQSIIPGLLQQAPAAPAAPAAPSIPGLPAIPGLSTPGSPATPAAPQMPQAKLDMPALPAGLPVNVPPQLTLPQDLPGLASGQPPAAPAAAASPAGPMAPLLSALP
jgi:hypothetical protein